MSFARRFVGLGAVVALCASLLTVAVAATPVLAAGEDEVFVISGVVDGPRTGGLPKAIELTAATDIADLSIYGVGSANNGGGSGGVEFTFPTGTVAAGESVCVATEASEFNAFFGFDPDHTSGTAPNINGDDAIELFREGAVIDTFGDINVDGTDQPWEYMDGWAKRVSGTGPDGATFDISSWTFSVPDALDGATTNDTASQPFPIDCGEGSGGGDDDGDGEACTAEATLISTVQGSGNASSMDGSTVTVRGVVTDDYTDSNIRGFALQEEDADADDDPATSEGILVFAPGAQVAVGDVVAVTGTVDEFFDLTELTSVSAIETCPELTGAVTPTDIDLPFPLPTDGVPFQERFENMVVTLASGQTVTEVFHLGRSSEFMVSSDGRLVQPTEVAAPGVDAQAVDAANRADMMIIDDGSYDQNPDPTLHPAGGLAPDNRIRGGDATTSDVTGVMTYSWSGYSSDNNYRIHAFDAATVDHTPAPAVPEVGGNLTVASYNVLNFFNGDGMGGGFPTSRGADTRAELERQAAKIVAAISAMDADVVGLIEIENDGFGPDSAIAELTERLNTAMGEGTYDYVDPGVSQIGTDAIAVGYIYKPATIGLSGAAAILDSAVDPNFDDTKNRPALAQSFVHLATGEDVTVAVNHLKSKGSSCDDVDDPDTGDGQGNCNRTRTRAAEALASWMAADPTGTGDADALIIGDLNSYAMEDPITTLEEAGYTQLPRMFGEEYSYVFKGYYGSLDHGLANDNLTARATGAASWHINADEASAFDYNNFNQPNLYVPDALRASDHDPVMFGFQLEMANAAPDCSVAAATPDDIWPPNHKLRDITVDGITDPDGDTISLSVTNVFQDEPVGGRPDAVIHDDGQAAVRAERDGDGDGRVYHLTFTATDHLGASCTGEATVVVPLDHDTPVGDGGALYAST